MPRFLPFPGLRYRTRDISAVSAPPYDVIEPEARAALEARDPHNAVRLILPDTYDAAATALAQWRDDAVLVTDDAPTFSIYRMDFTGDNGIPQRTTGVLGALALDDDGSGVMPHERTLPKAKSDRLELLRATRANLDPIWGLSLSGGLSSLLHPGDAEPDATAVDEDGFHHSLWKVTDPVRIAAISDAVGAELVVLADGHHRFETANNYRRERRAAGIDDRGADAIMTLIVELAPNQLCVRAIHRLLTGTGDVDLRDALGGPFFVHRAGPNVPEGVAALEVAMRDGDGLGLVDRDGLALLMPTAELELALERAPGRAARRRLRPLRRRRAPGGPGRVARVPQRRADRRRRGGQGRCRRRGAAAPGHRGDHPRRRGSRPPDAGEDDVLRTQAPYRHGVPQPGRLTGHRRANSLPRWRRCR